MTLCFTHVLIIILTIFLNNFIDVFLKKVFLIIKPKEVYHGCDILELKDSRYYTMKGVKLAFTNRQNSLSIIKGFHFNKAFLYFFK